MSDVHAKALERALLLLKAAGVKYAVIDQAGVKHGELEVAPEKTRHRKAGPRTDWTNVFPDYREQVEKLQVGGALKWACKDSEQAKGFQKTVSGKASAVFGTGNYLTSVTGNEVELLRVA